MDYAVKVTVRNGRILRLMRARGIASQTDLARLSGVSLQVVNQIVCLRKAPRKQNGCWLAGVEEIAGALGCDPEDMFSDSQQFLAIPVNSHEVYMDEARVAALVDSGEDKVWAKIGAQRLLGAISNPRHRKVTEAIIEGATFEEAGAEVGVTLERARQMYMKSLRKMKAKVAHGAAEIKSALMEDMINSGGING